MHILLEQIRDFLKIGNRKIHTLNQKKSLEMGKKGLAKLILAGGIVGRTSKRETTINLSNEFG